MKTKEDIDSYEYWYISSIGYPLDISIHENNLRDIKNEIVNVSVRFWTGSSWTEYPSFAKPFTDINSSDYKDELEKAKNSKKNSFHPININPLKRTVFYFKKNN